MDGLLHFFVAGDTLVLHENGLEIRCRILNLAWLIRTICLELDVGAHLVRLLFTLLLNFDEILALISAQGLVVIHHDFAHVAGR